MAAPIPDVSLIDNSDERLPLVLVLDCSGSMAGEPIRQLNEGLKTLADTMRNDTVTATRGRVLTIQYGGNNEVIISDWQDAMDWTPPEISADGLTPTGAAVTAALDAIEAQKAELRSAGVSYKRPIMLLMSDGAPTDDWKKAAEACRKAEQAKKVTVMAVAVGPDMDKSILDQFSTKKALELVGLRFKELFIWLSQSVRAVSQATTGETVQISPPSSWSNIGTD